MEYLYTVDETAKLLKVNRNMVYDLINTGHLRAIKLGRKKIPAFEIERFLKQYIGKDMSDLSRVEDLKTKETA
ncbi:helix-turn-helix domain-containing protein [Clostridium botulinum]|uniref:helix-turn-helix domain-containing protein n=1 Tax=Clostridium botulinum TaxID=1491 RepID=UPI0007731BEA|nr:helix-turn-helix domain-containing protein [Clostridium botulinum]APH22744.1 DNA binding, excisionase family domain protein [Clostridium botulinum]AUN23191.1 transcriptional regulator [Clostridium botulinum]MBN3372126.1 DNA-binding protein [Clostridium botulinum]MBN3375922.1 DNA-binding protein [Clostridium botulinum]MBN3380669.1 DNA-binding protein [Clostridium botulinum]